MACSRSLAALQSARETRSFHSGIRLPSGQASWQKGTPQSIQRSAWAPMIGSSAPGTWTSCQSRTRSSAGLRGHSSRGVVRKPLGSAMAVFLACGWQAVRRGAALFRPTIRPGPPRAQSAGRLRAHGVPAVAAPAPGRGGGGSSGEGQHVRRRRRGRGDRAYVVPRRPLAHVRGPLGGRPPRYPAPAGAARCCAAHWRPRSPRTTRTGTARCPAAAPPRPRPATARTSPRRSPRSAPPSPGRRA